MLHLSLPLHSDCPRPENLRTAAPPDSGISNHFVLERPQTRLIFERATLLHSIRRLRFLCFHIRIQLSLDPLAWQFV